MMLRIDQLTFTRFVAAMTVVFFHYGGGIPYLNRDPWSALLRAGNISVSYFFTLSGFIMAIAYYSLETQKLGKARYAVARFARIYPIYLIGLLLIAPLVMYSENNGKRALLLNLGLLQAWFPGYAMTFNSPGWSLSVEMFFYVFFPFLLIFLAKRSPKLLLGGAGIFWLASQILHSYLLNYYYVPYPSPEHDFVFYFPLLHLNAFVLGLVLGMIFKRYRQRLELGPRVSFWGVLLSFVAICISIMYWSELTAWTGVSIALTNGVLSPLFGIFIIFLSLDTSIISRVMQHKALILLGEASYGIYILQEPLSQIYFYQFAKWMNWSDAVHFYVFVGFLILISIIMMKWVENPARFWLRKQGQKIFD
jgi:peptidoglycan/LPS O-acetylase OafA/YrhL